MRFEINLASQPFGATRRFYARWRWILFCAALAAAVLVWYALFTWLNTRDVRRQLAELRRQQASVNAEKRHAENVLNEPANRSVRDSSQLINDLIARKAFSWTTVFSDLEKLMPARVRVLSIKPSLKDNQLVLALRVEAESHESVAGPQGLLRRLEQSRTFRHPVISTETPNEQGRGQAPGVTFEISTDYVPQAGLTAVETAATQGER